MRRREKLERNEGDAEAENIIFVVVHRSVSFFVNMAQIKNHRLNFVSSGIGDEGG
jgi:hypothetical protein